MRRQGTRNELAPNSITVRAGPQWANRCDRFDRFDQWGAARAPSILRSLQESIFWLTMQLSKNSKD